MIKFDKNVKLYVSILFPSQLRIYVSYNANTKAEGTYEGKSPCK